MFAQSLARQPLAISFSLRLLLVAMLLVGSLSPAFAPSAAAAPQADVLQTIGDFLSLGANTVRELQKAIAIAGGEMRTTLEQLNNDINTTMQTLSRTYQDNLNITINSLDAASRNKILELQGLIDQVNQTLQQDITLASQAAKDVIRQASLQIRQVSLELEQSLQRVVILVGETAVYVVDRTIYDIIMVGAMALLGLGLLLFIWLLFSRRLPSGLPGFLALLFIAAFLAVFGALALVPPVRGYAMTYTGLGIEQRLETVRPQPRILDIVPDTITLGQTREVEVWGNTLRPEGVSPTIKIANRPVPMKAASDQLVVADVAGLSAPEGSTNLVLAYDGHDGPTGVVRLANVVPPQVPPDLTISSYSVDPASPVQRGNARASITVRNQGSGPAKSFVVQWRPYAGHPGLSTQVPGLNAGASQTFTFDFAYPNAGPVDAVALVDVFNSVAETNEGNNSMTRSLNVQPAPPRRARVRVTFTQITVEDDADPAGSGEIWLDFNVSGQTGRWPSSGTKDAESGNTYAIGKAFDVLLTEGEKLTIYMNGTDEDSPGFPLFDNNDPLGTVSREFVSANEWGKGNHNDKSTCPDGCYTIHYTIEVNWL